jgi:hypothetical protein
MTKLQWTNEKRKLRDLIPWKINPRQIREEQAKRLKESLDEFAQVETIAISPDGDVYNGHQRLKVWEQNYGGDLEVDVRVSSRPLTEDERKKLTVFLHKGATGEWDYDLLANNFDVSELLDWGFQESDLFMDWGDSVDGEGMEEGEVPDAQPSPRDLPIDAIVTISLGGFKKGRAAEPTSLGLFCCLGIKSGWKYGFMSGSQPCSAAENMKGHEPAFIDNWYYEYDHETHIAAVEKYRPKYCTVMDIMTPEQCEKQEVVYHGFDQIMLWAEQLEQYAENVIIIPKYDCLKDIPERYVLGYSVPTSHGGTPLSVDLFRGRRVHLLGGSWKKQLNYMAALGDDVVSFDNNYILKQARWGSFCYPDGSTGDLRDELGLSVNNHLYTSMAISLGHIATKLNELYGHNMPVEEVEKEELSPSPEDR